MWTVLTGVLASAGGDVMEVQLTPQMLTVIPLLLMAMQMIKGFEPVAKLTAWFPLMTMAVAVVLAILMQMGPDVQSQVMSGVVMGLATCGGYDAAKLPGKVAALRPVIKPPAGDEP